MSCFSFSFLLLSALFQPPGVQDNPSFARHLDTAVQIQVVLLGDRVISFPLTQILASHPFSMVFHMPESVVYMTESNSFVDRRCCSLHVLFKICV
ncbi:hypothetical protein B0T20DRAFT_399537, partial [Sordaria brevicollis]